MNEALQNELHIAQAEGFETKEKDRKIMLLHKDSYGSRQAARESNKVLCKLVATLVFININYYESLYMGTETDGRMTIVVTYVDYMLIVGPCKKKLN